MSTLTIPTSFPIRKGLFIFVTQPYPAAVLALHMQYYRFHTCAVRTVISSLAPGTKERANSRIRSAISYYLRSDYSGYNPAHPDALDSFKWNDSPFTEIEKPDGN